MAVVSESSKLEDTSAVAPSSSSTLTTHCEEVYQPCSVISSKPLSSVVKSCFQFRGKRKRKVIHELDSVIQVPTTLPKSAIAENGTLKAIESPRKRRRRLGLRSMDERRKNSLMHSDGSSSLSLPSDSSSLSIITDESWTEQSSKWARHYRDSGLTLSDRLSLIEDISQYGTLWPVLLDRSDLAKQLPFETLQRTVVSLLSETQSSHIQNTNQNMVDESDDPNHSYYHRLLDPQSIDFGRERRRRIELEKVGRRQLQHERELLECMRALSETQARLLRRVWEQQCRVAAITELTAKPSSDKNGGFVSSNSSDLESLSSLSISSEQWNFVSALECEKFGNLDFIAKHRNSGPFRIPPNLFDSVGGSQNIGGDLSCTQLGLGAALSAGLGTSSSSGLPSVHSRRDWVRSTSADVFDHFVVTANFGGSSALLMSNNGHLTGNNGTANNGPLLIKMDARIPGEAEMNPLLSDGMMGAEMSSGMDGHSDGLLANHHRGAGKGHSGGIFDSTLSSVTSVSNGSRGSSNRRIRERKRRNSNQDAMLSLGMGDSSLNGIGDLSSSNSGFVDMGDAIVDAVNRRLVDSGVFGIRGMESSEPSLEVNGPCTFAIRNMIRTLRTDLMTFYTLKAALLNADSSSAAAPTSASDAPSFTVGANSPTSQRARKK